MNETRHDLTRTTLAVLFIGGLIAASFLVMRPFLGATVWATTLVISTWPLMLRLQAALGGRRWLAVTLMTLGLLLIVILPLSVAIGTIVVNSNRIMDLIAAVPDFHVPAAPDWLADIPIIGGPAPGQTAKIPHPRPPPTPPTTPPPLPPPTPTSPPAPPPPPPLSSP